VSNVYDLPKIRSIVAEIGFHAWWFHDYKSDIENDILVWSYKLIS